MTIKTEQFDCAKLEAVDFDLIIASSGYESRASFLISELSKLKAKKKIVFLFDNHKNNAVRIYNDNIFHEAGYIGFTESGDKSDFIQSVLHSNLDAVADSPVRVLVDYSCMTRVWYAEILKVFYNLDVSSAEIYFSYSVSKYIDPPQNSALNKFVSPIPGFYSISVPTKPTALIIGLGYVASRAHGLSEYFDTKPYLFISDSGFNADFHKEVMSQNSALITFVPEEHIFYYPLNNLMYTETVLNHLCKDLLDNYRVVLAPCGPKPFTLISLITSIRQEDIDVWRISAGENESPTDKKPSGDILILKCTFSRK